MSQETRLKFKDALLLMIDSEVKGELLRHELSSSPYFSAKVAFCNFETEEPQESSHDNEISLRNSINSMRS
jgi:hypothetical protein